MTSESAARATTVASGKVQDGSAARPVIERVRSLQHPRSSARNAAIPIRFDARTATHSFGIRDCADALLAERNSEGFWIGELSSSALATATAVAALTIVDRSTKAIQTHAALIDNGLRWLVDHQNADGGWGDTVKSVSNISTTMLCRAAFHVTGRWPSDSESNRRCEAWLRQRYGKTPEELAEAVRQRYGTDRTFSVPILMMCIWRASYRGKKYRDCRSRWRACRSRGTASHACRSSATPCPPSLPSARLYIIIVQRGIRLRGCFGGWASEEACVCWNGFNRRAAAFSRRRR